MAREGTLTLDSGDKFPALAIQTVAHGSIRLPGGAGSGWRTILFYRAHW